MRGGGVQMRGCSAETLNGRSILEEVKPLCPSRPPGPDGIPGMSTAGRRACCRECPGEHVATQSLDFESLLLLPTRARLARNKAAAERSQAGLILLNNPQI